MSGSEDKKPGTNQGAPQPQKGPEKTIFDRLKDLPGAPIKRNHLKNSFDRTGETAQAPQPKKEE